MTHTLGTKQVKSYTRLDEKMVLHRKNPDESLFGQVLVTTHETSEETGQPFQFQIYLLAPAFVKDIKNALWKGEMTLSDAVEKLKTRQFELENGRDAKSEKAIFEAQIEGLGAPYGCESTARTKVESTTLSVNMTAEEVRKMAQKGQSGMQEKRDQCEILNLSKCNPTQCPVIKETLDVIMVWITKVKNAPDWVDGEASEIFMAPARDGEAPEPFPGEVAVRLQTALECLAAKPSWTAQDSIQMKISSTPFEKKPSCDDEMSELIFSMGKDEGVANWNAANRHFFLDTLRVAMEAITKSNEKLEDQTPRLLSAHAMLLVTSIQQAMGHLNPNFMQTPSKLQSFRQKNKYKPTEEELFEYVRTTTLKHLLARKTYFTSHVDDDDNKKKKNAAYSNMHQKLVGIIVTVLHYLGFTKSDKKEDKGKGKKRTGKATVKSGEMDDVLADLNAEDDDSDEESPEKKKRKSETKKAVKK